MAGPPAEILRRQIRMPIKAPNWLREALKVPYHVHGRGASMQFRKTKVLTRMVKAKFERYLLMTLRKQDISPESWDSWNSGRWLHECRIHQSVPEAKHTFSFWKIEKLKFGARKQRRFHWFVHHKCLLKNPKANLTGLFLPSLLCVSAQVFPMSWLVFSKCLALPKTMLRVHSNQT